MRKIKLLYLLFLFPFLAAAQNKNITGNILDENSMPLPGASVIVKGTSIGVSVDFDGNFSLSIPEDSKTLVISFLGYITEEVTIGDKTNFIVKLITDAESLEEVVVIGYGTQRKSDITGAVTSVKVTDEARAQFNTVDGLLQGRAAGVQVTRNAGSPGSGVSVTVRGVGTLGTNNQPLYVIDGIIIESAGEDVRDSGIGGNSRVQAQNGLNGINPRDIESIEVLKDASSTAIYGSRGANGVILVTTKKGKSGNKGTITAFYNTGVVDVTRTLDVLDTFGYAEYSNEAQAVQNNGPLFAIRDGQVFPVNQNDQGQQVISNSAVEQRDWQKELFKPGFSTSAGGSFSGGSDTGNYRVSAVYNDQSGIVDNSDFKSGNVTINLNKDLTPKLKLSTRVNTFFASGNSANAGDRAGGNRGFISQVVNFPPLFRSPEDVINEGLESNGPDGFINGFQDVSEETRIIGSLSLTRKDLFNVKGLSYKIQAGGNIRIKERKRFFGDGTFLGNQLDGALGISNLVSRSYQVNNLFTYNKNFNRKHRINAVAGITYDVRQSENSIYGVQDFVTKQFGVDVPQIGALITTPLNTQILKTQLLSYLTRVNYTFKNKYVFTGSFRADGSSRFAEGNRYSYFPSFSLAWKADKEKFLKNVDFINSLKFRAGWGQTGSQAIAAFATQSTFSSIDFANENASTGIGFVARNLANRDLIWETTSQLNLGVDFGLLKNRITGSVDVYDRQTNDLLLIQPIAPSNGFSTVPANTGGIQNRGLELTLEGVAINKNDFSVRIGGNIAVNRNEITGLGSIPESPIYVNGELQSRRSYIGQTISSGTFFRSPANIFIEGEAVGLFYGFETNGIYQTEDTDIIAGAVPGDVRLIDQDGNGVINGLDRTIIGNPTPDFTYGGNVNIKYKNVSLSAQFNGVYGNDIANGNLLQIGNAEGAFNNILESTFRNAWRPDAQSNTVPRIGFIGGALQPAISDRIIEDGSFLRINNITLSVDVSLEKSNIFKNANIFVSGNNLFTFTNYSGFDPEITGFRSTGTIVGVDFNGFPNAREIVLGLNLTF